MSPERWIFLVTITLLGGVGPSQATEESVALKGRVVDAASGAAISGAEIKAGEARARTDSGGFFEISLPRGVWSLEVTAGNHVDYAGRVDLKAGPLPVLEIALQPKVRFHERVDVTAPGAAPDGPATLAVRPGQVLTVAGSLDNIFRVLQTLPGVVGTDEIGSRLSVRGGSPDENLTIMDGIEIHNPYRLFGLTSAFNPETVERFEFTAGGFGVKHGDRLSSLLIVENRDGSREKRLRGSSSLSLTDGNLIVEGKLPGQAKGSWLLTARRTYYDLFAERVIHQDLPAFQDFQFKAAWEPRDGQRLTLFGLRSREGANAAFDGDTPGSHGAFLGDVHNDLLSASFQSKVGGSISKTIASWYQETSFFDANGRFRSDSRRSNTPDPEATPLTGFALSWNNPIRDLSVREELSLPIGRRHLLETGFEVHRLRSSLIYTIGNERNPTEANGSSVRGGAGLPGLLDSASSYTRSGAWIEVRFRLGDATTLAPGLRVDWSGLTGRSTVSPRLNATVSLGRSTRLRAALGLYTQSPGYEKLAQSDYLVDQLHLDFERARHAIVGLERDLAPGLTARVELYHKRFDHLVIGRLETEAEVQDRISRYDFPPELQGEIPRAPLVTSFPTNGGKGTAYGFDVYVARPAWGLDRRLTGWASYTFGVADREAYGRVYPFDYDRRHSVSIVGNYRFGPRFSMSATGRASSGFPWTPFAGIQVASLDDGTRIVPERDLEGRLVYTVAPGGIATLNTARLPFQARLDVRATFRPRGEKGRWQFYLEILNALNRHNTSRIGATLEYDPLSDRPRLVETRGSEVRRLPSFGVRFQFD